MVAASEREHLLENLQALDRWLDDAIAAFAQAFVSANEHVIASQQQAIRSLSTPVLQLHPGLLILPMVGALDRERLDQMRALLLAAVSERRARAVVLDVTGVPEIDSVAANQLIGSVTSARMMGAEVIISGLSAEIAQTLVTVGIDLEPRGLRGRPAGRNRAGRAPPGLMGDPATPHLRDLARLRRVRDRIDREYAQPLDVEALARDAHMSAGHFSREFRRAYGESPYSYLMTRRIERAMALLRRGDLSVTEVCFEVGCSSLGTFSTRFSELVGMPPSVYREEQARATAGMPSCVAKQVTKPVRNREARTPSRT